MKHSQEPQLKKAFVDTGGIDINAVIDSSIGVGQYEPCLSFFWHESDWSRRKILLFFLLFLNNGMNNGRLSSATGGHFEFLSVCPAQ